MGMQLVGAKCASLAAGVGIAGVSPASAEPTKTPRAPMGSSGDELAGRGSTALSGCVEDGGSGGTAVASGADLVGGSVGGVAAAGGDEADEAAGGVGVAAGRAVAGGAGGGGDVTVIGDAAACVPDERCAALATPSSAGRPIIDAVKRAKVHPPTAGDTHWRGWRRRLKMPLRQAQAGVPAGNW